MKKIKSKTQLFTQNIKNKNKHKILNSSDIPRNKIQLSKENQEKANRKESPFTNYKNESQDSMITMSNKSHNINMINKTEIINVQDINNSHILLNKKEAKKICNDNLNLYAKESKECVNEKANDKELEEKISVDIFFNKSPKMKKLDLKIKKLEDELKIMPPNPDGILCYNSSGQVLVKSTDKNYDKIKQINEQIYETTKKKLDTLKQNRICLENIEQLIKNIEKYQLTMEDLYNLQEEILDKENERLRKEVDKYLEKNETIDAKLKDKMEYNFKVESYELDKRKTINLSNFRNSNRINNEKINKQMNENEIIINENNKLMEKLKRKIMIDEEKMKNDKETIKNLEEERINKKHKKGKKEYIKVRL